MPLDRLEIVFDGGSRGNPGRAYGSFLLRTAGKASGRLERVSWGKGTNNEAEYWTLQAALRAAGDYLESLHMDPGRVELIIRGDSRLVLEQLRGTWKAKNPRMKNLRDETLQLLKSFAGVRFVHQPRERSVAVLGH
jgi:ribonuclease HI